ncbi:hypothetical protein IJ00_02720 [Calothrix sp. 336/3]|nr:hypothetical protein IJ00_02720 [Calothrix sp. 336/3]
MGLKYYTLVMLNSTGKRQIREIEGAKIFFTETFADWINTNNFSDVFIQKRLLELWQNNSSPSNLLAQRCLLCWISWQIEQVCFSLEQQFGHFHGFTHSDLLPYVLDDDGNLQTSANYQCWSREILATFEPDKSSLTTWTSRKVRQHRELNKYLLECGLYLVSDWAILNDTKPQQLAKILGEFHSLTDLEIRQAQNLLSAYHKIYRAERFRQRANSQSKSKCQSPTTQQLQEIVEILQAESVSKFSIISVLQSLQTIANYLREYRIHVRIAALPTVSLDAELHENSTFLEMIPASNSENLLISTDDDNETEAFLKMYRNQFLNCLDNALNTVVDLRMKKLQKKDINKAKQFLIGLQLFHCQRLSMGKIAQQLGLRAQDAVARLLKLKEFRADVRQEILVKLQAQVIELAQKFSTPTKLKKLESQITELLDEQINRIISEAEVEAASIQNNADMSYFSQRLCQKLGNR